MNITVIGCGYLGAVHAAAMAEEGHTVLGVDINPGKIAALNKGMAPFHEAGLQDLLTRHTLGLPDSTGRLSFTTDYERAARFGDVHFLCVGTPPQADGACDLTHIHAAVNSLAPHLKRPCLVVGKSTVPVGTAELLAPRIQDLAPAGEDVELAWNPEFLREGRAVADTLHPDRIVVGVASEKAEKLLREVYVQTVDYGTPFLVTDYATAELVKVSANSFLAMKISFINAMAEICDTAGADVMKLAEALGHDDRIGNKFLRPGIGYGGGCLPKDLRAFASHAEELGRPETLGMLYEADAVNARARRNMVTMAVNWLDKPVHQSRIAVLGATFKPDTDDVRDSPALAIASALERRGARVSVYDPHGSRNAARECPELDYAASITEAAEDADLVLHLTEWKQFQELDPTVLTDVVTHRRIIDGRGTLDVERWNEAGWTIRAPGRPRL